MDRLGIVAELAKHRQSGEPVAIKQLLKGRRSKLCSSTVMEIQCLRAAAHENVVRLRRVIVDGRLEALCLVLEHCPYELHKLLHKCKYTFEETEVSRDPV